MRLFLPMAFGLLVFASVAWGQVEEDEYIEVMESEENYSVFGEDDASGLKEYSSNDIQSGFNVTTGDLGMNSHATPDVNMFSREAPVSGFNVATGVLGLGVAKAVKDAGNLETIHVGFNATTGELGLPTRTIECDDKSSNDSFLTSFGKDYYVLVNVSPMTEKVGCGQTVTYATSTDFISIRDLPAFIDRWRAPMSIALYAPGTDFQLTIDSIRYLKSCASPLISQFVSFHIYWHKEHRPQKVMQTVESLSQSYNCKETPPWDEVSIHETYKNQNGLFDFKNGAQSIAKQAAATHYIMVADFGYIPSENLASEFIKMITWNAQPELRTRNPKVFVLMLIAIDPEKELPTNKTSLVDLLNDGTANVIIAGEPCGLPIVSPDPEWQQKPQTKNLRVSAPLKRTGYLQFWSPIFIGTIDDPDFDLRVTISGEKTRDWLLCAQDYEFLILNNAFMVRHLNYFVGYESFSIGMEQILEDVRIIQNVILPEYQQKYGRDKGCVM